VIETVGVEFPDDAGLVAVLRGLGVAPGAYVGHGGEAWVYGLDDDRVVRVLHETGTAEQVQRRALLVNELSQSHPAFALPEIMEIGESEGRVFVIERRLTGRPVLSELAQAEGSRRTRLIEAHLAAAAALGDLDLAGRDYFGDLIGDDPIRTDTWQEYLYARAATNLARSTSDLAQIDAGPLAAGLLEPSEASFVHLDAFAGNMLTDGHTVTAVLDFGSTSVRGDRRLDPLASAVYLLAPDITPTGRDADGDVVASWLRARGLDDLLEYSKRMSGSASSSMVRGLKSGPQNSVNHRPTMACCPRCS
jgi:aminoglycoside phosphotransferase (APT) family kinase protein